MRNGSWMLTATGRTFWPLDPRAEEIDIMDIAHSLSLQCRFGGHVKEFYSVAQHSVYVSRVVKPSDAVWGLLHDASEAYCQDLIRPVKRHLAGYVQIEERIQLCIAEKFNLPWPMPEDVHQADKAVLSAELLDLKMPAPAGYSFIETAKPPAGLVIAPWPMHEIKELFLNRCKQLGII